MDNKTLTPITRMHEASIQAVSEGWSAQYSQYITHACTLSIRQPKNKHEFNIEHIWKQWGNFCKYLNRLVYGHAGKRGKKSLVIIPALHGQTSYANLHFHVGIGCVDKDYTHAELTALINNAWRHVSWTKNRTDIQPYRNLGWDNYIYKESVWLDLQAGDIARSCIPPSLKAEVLS